MSSPRMHPEKKKKNLAGGLFESPNYASTVSGAALTSRKQLTAAPA